MPSSHDIQLAISRIQLAMSGQRKPGYRDIRLGLDRVKSLYKKEQKWEAFHVGGTNGKGSICNYLGGMFKLAGIGYGSYTSPAFPEKHNGVIINGRYVNPRLYEVATQDTLANWNRISTRWSLRHAEDAATLTPFEIETVTAFRCFEQMRVPYGIVEVGMGGATDATNIIQKKAVTIISKIGLDHQEYLGNTIENIAKVKAGIMQRGVPCIVDHTNPPAVIRVLREHAREIGTEITLTWKAEPLLMTLDKGWKLEDYQIQNLLCAATAFRRVFPLKEINLDKVLKLVRGLPGRLEKVRYSSKATNISERLLLVDGAHNMLGVEGLDSYVVNRFRTHHNRPVTWVMGMSSSKFKPFDQIIEKLVRPHDNLAFVEFEQQDNDPPPAPADIGRDHGRIIVKDDTQVYDGEPNLEAALQWACEKAAPKDLIVVTGSLYLVRDLFKLEGIRRTREIGTIRPGQAQLRRFNRTLQERELTPEEDKEWKRARRHWWLSPLHNPVLTDAGRRTGLPDDHDVSGEKQRLRQKASYHRNTIKSSKAEVARIKEEMEKPDAPESLSEDLEALEIELAVHKEDYDSCARQLRENPEEKRAEEYKIRKSTFPRPKPPRPRSASPWLLHQEAEEFRPVEERRRSYPWEKPVGAAAATASGEEFRPAEERGRGYPWEKPDGAVAATVSEEEKRE